ncbi:NADH-FMN oxidoreductase RutF, flavin reductase (DIM6/NTAB) family [Roseivivax lentus]|uniref:NADH-FMN oxidoreductase RutF, flavin reductase (DIM6/NTAB) family n=1 Tax=Roseivivax lentus TaxID=633194 RepID=A0A1N7PU79_9RHOB|nr:flavin reductase family protein [Roseivivax lentus]SIT14105.1 NADH-FMN oxidoreductase RutF, flavin reductase (DIM6/NTAB) family [Roseivivax lentus]
MGDATPFETQTFVPGPETQRAFRDALGQFATGVTIVTTDTPDGPLAITANSFASLSLDPPLVLWSPARASKRFAPFTECTRYAIHVLAEDQGDLCHAVARDGRALGPDVLRTGDTGIPVIEQALARYECTRHAVHDGGDHAIVVGEVTQVTRREGSPLLFLNGQLGGFAAR